MSIAKLAHAIVASKIPAFRKIFRQSPTNFLFLIQLTSDDLLVTLDEKLNEDAGYFSINCLENDKHLFRFLCVLEMADNTQMKNLSDLCGIRLLYELCNACNILPQVPVTTLSIIFEVMQTAGPAETSPYRKEFFQMGFPRLRFLVSEDDSSHRWNYRKTSRSGISKAFTKNACNCGSTSSQCNRKNWHKIILYFLLFFILFFVVVRVNSVMSISLINKSFITVHVFIVFRT